MNPSKARSFANRCRCHHGGATSRLVVMAALGLMTVSASRALASNNSTSAAIGQQLKACEALAPLFKPGAPAVRVDAVGGAAAGTVWHVAVSRQRWLAFVSPTGGDCEVRKIGRADARVRADLWPGRPGKEKAYFLAGSDGCKGCDLIAAVRGDGDTPLTAIRINDTCDMGVSARRLRLFPKTDSVALRCRSSMGAGSFRETLWVLHVVDGVLRVVLTGDMGFHEEPSETERAAGACPAEPAGWIKVVSKGARPVVRLLEAKDEHMVDARGTAQVFEHIYTPASRSFVRRGQPQAIPFDMRSRCRLK